MQTGLFERRVIFVTGKGGVGKTTVSCALALCAARRGKRVLLVETGPKENMSFIFGTDPVGYQPLEVYPGVLALFLEPYAALTEFLQHRFYIGGLARRFVNNRMFRYLAEVAPGWRELITLGKIWTREQAKTGRKGRPVHDLIIVDAPSTGHGLSFLRVPQVLLDTLAFGPIKHYTGLVQKMLEDPELTSLNVVTLAEEMPVAETTELIQTAHQTVRVPLGLVFANAVYPEVFGWGGKTRFRKLDTDDLFQAELDLALGEKVSAADVLSCARSLARRRELNEHYLRQLKQQVELPVVELPYMFTEHFDVRDLEELSKRIDQALENGS